MAIASLEFNLNDGKSTHPRVTMNVGLLGQLTKEQHSHTLVCMFEQAAKAARTNNWELINE